MLNILGYLIGLLCSILFVAIFKFYNKFWLVPTRIKNVLNSQQIMGPSYNFIHGNTKEISMLRNKSMILPMDTSSHNIFPRVQPHMDACFRIYGKNFLYWHGPQPELVIAEPKLLKEVMSEKEISMGRPDMGPVFKRLHKEGLLLSEGDKWVKKRKIATHAFNGQRLKDMIPAMIESVSMMLKRWKDAKTKEMDVYAEFKILTSEVISRTAFGSSYEEGKQVFQKLGALSLLAAKNSNKNRLLGFGKIFKDKDVIESNKLDTGIQEIILQMIRNRESMPTSQDEENFKSDYLGLLLNAQYYMDKDCKFSIQEIIGDCKTFYSAGHGMTSILLSWMTLLLGIHTEWQEKARMEVQEVFGQQIPSSDGVAKLKIIGMIINETLRLYPPAVVIIRKVSREMKVGKLIVPANINLHVPVLALHHDPEIWGKDAHLFKPERFSEGIAKATNNNPGAFIPFGYGPRNCVGSNFALNEAKVTLSMILQHYRFTPSSSYVHEPILQLVTPRPKYGVQMIFQDL
uniref:cytochrome P450 CYP749A22-like n=1 Tax=Erigeron canadensis TaxID=72917 RepID=UPI001CB91F6F|nr:cytochrome P450 CYP749A22-like [Erigeron canadensis]